MHQEFYLIYLTGVKHGIAFNYRQSVRQHCIEDTSLRDAHVPFNKMGNNISSST